MRAGRESAPRWIVLSAIGLAGLLLLACVVPSYINRATPTSPPVATPTPALTPTLLAGTAPVVQQITEQDLNQWLQGVRPALGEGIDCQEIHVQIRSTGLILSVSVKAAQLAGALIPVEIHAMPVVREERVKLEVLDVRLGGPYAAMSSFIKPVLITGITDAFNADTFLTQQGVRISNIELKDGYMLVTSVPAS